MSTSHPEERLHDTGLESRLCALVADVAEMDTGSVAPDLLFYDDLLLDSLQLLEIVVRIERCFGVRLTDAEAAGLASVLDAARLLRGRELG